jgi:hypothetical protein
MKPLVLLMHANKNKFKIQKKKKCIWKRMKIKATIKHSFSQIKLTYILKCLIRAKEPGTFLSN